MNKENIVEGAEVAAESLAAWLYGDGSAKLLVSMGLPASGNTAASGDVYPSLLTTQLMVPVERHTLFGHADYHFSDTLTGFAEGAYSRVDGSVLQKLLTDAADKSLNCVTVDGDTSTSDTLLLAATGSARHAPIEEADDPVLVDFKRALDELLIDLAQLLARDGEGATKFITINVGGASSNGAARKIGLAVANSPLVKTAIAGEDANWGRIVMAVGKSGERADRDKLKISIGGVKITDAGQVVPNYDEAPVAKHIKGTDIVIDIDLGIGRGRATVWTCDLTHGYIDINGSYRS